MRKDETQFCIDGVLVSEVLEDLSDKVSIIGAKVVVGKGFSKHKVVIPNRLKRWGVQSLQEHEPAQEATLVFDSVSKSTILAKTRQVAHAIGADANKAYFRYLTVGIEGAAGKFVRCTKDMRPHDEDLRKKLVVLGLIEAQGEVKELIAVLHAKPYRCTIETVEVRTIICSRM